MPVILKGLNGWWIAPLLVVASLDAGSSDLRLVEAAKSGDAYYGLLLHNLSPKPA